MGFNNLQFFLAIFWTKDNEDDARWFDIASCEHSLCFTSKHPLLIQSRTDLSYSVTESFGIYRIKHQFHLLNLAIYVFLARTIVPYYSVYSKILGLAVCTQNRT
jgi:hypothetical protein